MSDSTPLPVPLIVDTDIGTDIDDLLALIIAATDPRWDLLAVTTVNGNTGDRAAFARRVLDTLGRNDVAVGAGHSDPLSGRPNSCMPRPTLERHRTPTGYSHRFDNAVSVISTAVRRSPRPVTICGIGAYSNLVDTIDQDPSLLDGVAGLHLMGGCLADMAVAGQVVSHASYTEYNISGDPWATERILSYPVPRVLVPVDLTYRLRLSQRSLRSMARGTVLASLLEQEIAAFQHEFLTPRVARSTGPRAATIILNDPAALLSTVLPATAFTDRSLRVATTADGVRLRCVPGGELWRVPREIDRGEVIDTLGAALARLRTSEPACTKESSVG